MHSSFSHHGHSRQSRHDSGSFERRYDCQNEPFNSSSDSESVSPSSPSSFASTSSSLASSPALQPTRFVNGPFPELLSLSQPSADQLSSYAATLIRNEAYALLSLASRIAPLSAPIHDYSSDSSEFDLIEPYAIESISNVEFRRCVEMLASLPAHGKIIVTGVGKSGIVAKKMVATFNSLGSTAVFLHPLEALHGDLGVICPCSPHSPCDAMLLISHSGATAELMRLIPIVRNRVKNLIAITRDSESILSQACNGWLDAGTGAIAPTAAQNGGEKGTDEADCALPAPTSSVVAALAVGDAVALCLSRMRVGWDASGKERRVDFLRNHPGGQIGLNLTSSGERRSK